MLMLCLDADAKIKKLQKQDAQISQTIENVKRHKLSGYVIEIDFLFNVVVSVHDFL
jgi:hypothetical protein